MSLSPAQQAARDQLDAGARDLFESLGLESVGHPRSLDRPWLEAHAAMDLMAVLVAHARRSSALGHLDTIVGFPNPEDPGEIRFLFFTVRKKTEDAT